MFFLGKFFSKRVWCIGLMAVMVLALGFAWACAPSYRVVLNSRDQTLMAAPDYHVYDFVDEMRLDEFDLEMFPEFVYGNSILEYEGVSEEQYKQMLKMREAISGDLAYELGVGLPEDVRLYIAGAVEFEKYEQSKAVSDNGNVGMTDLSNLVRQQHWGKAKAYFEAVLALPNDQSRQRSVPAAFMLGRMYAMEYGALVDARLEKVKKQKAANVQTPLVDRHAPLIDDQRAVQSYVHDFGVSADLEQEFRGKSIQYFQLTRDLVQQGAHQIDYLTLASLGYEARVNIWPCRWKSQDEKPASECVNLLSVKNFQRAIYLYLAQAMTEKKYGYDGKAVYSLEHVSAFVLDHPDLLLPLMQDAAVRRLLLTYSFYRGARSSERYLKTLDEVLRAQPDIDLGREGAKLAIFNYRHGRYEQAARIANQSTEPVAAWVRAKLALQRGDERAAAKEYAQVFEAFRSGRLEGSHLFPTDEALLFAETGILALARSDYLEATQLFFNAEQKDCEVDVRRAVARKAGHKDDADALFMNSDGYFTYSADVSYIAERLLTVDELKRFVDQSAPAQVNQSGDEWGVHSCTGYPLRLRWLLARRLVREGRYDEALAYFPKKDDPRLSLDDFPESKYIDYAAIAKEYANELKASQSFWQTDISRAEHLYNAAVILSHYGMVIMGFEQDPDYTVDAGNGSGGISAPSENNKWVSRDEVKQYKMSGSKPDKRFHYRYVAIDLAEQAADQVPAWSQAFAAILCNACFWEKDGNENKKRLYQRYLKEGAAVPWRFNKKECPAPDFDKARRDVWKFRFQAWHQFAREHKPWVLLGSFLLVALMGLILMRIWVTGLFSCKPERRVESE